MRFGSGGEAGGGEAAATEGGRGSLEHAHAHGGALPGAAPR